MRHIDQCAFGAPDAPGRGVTPSARPATSPSICGNEATDRSGDEAQTALHVRRGLPATVWCRRQADIADCTVKCRIDRTAPPRIASGKFGVPRERGRRGATRGMSQKADRALLAGSRRTVARAKAEGWQISEILSRKTSSRGRSQNTVLKCCPI
jgi:hypothetical protein